MSSHAGCSSHTLRQCVGVLACTSPQPPCSAARAQGNRRQRNRRNPRALNTSRGERPKTPWGISAMLGELPLCHKYKVTDSQNVVMRPSARFQTPAFTYESCSSGWLDSPPASSPSSWSRDKWIRTDWSSWRFARGWRDPTRETTSAVALTTTHKLWKWTRDGHKELHDLICSLDNFGILPFKTHQGSVTRYFNLRKNLENEIMKASCKCFFSCFLLHH